MLLSFGFSLSHIGSIALLVFGFGFVIFWHELGHFLAAKWVGIKVEQFAVGFGHAMLSWRKGVGFRVGNSQKDYHDRSVALLESREKDMLKLKEKGSYSDAEISAAAHELGIGETEYRLNWIPLGGYVKMLGQDDLKPDAVAEDPRAYNKKSVGARMLVISAGVIMNVILAAIGFMALFLMGFKVPPAWVGNLTPNSPAQRAGLHVGDRILTFDGAPQHDFTKIMLNMALVHEGAPIHMTVERPDPSTGKFQQVDLTVTPERSGGDKFLAIGFSPPARLEGPPKDEVDPLDVAKTAERVLPDQLAVLSGDAITAINGEPVKPEDFQKLDAADQASDGKPIQLTVKSADGAERKVEIQPHFEAPFRGPFNIAGFLPRVSVLGLEENSTAIGKVKPGDVITAFHDSDPWRDPTEETVRNRLHDAGESGNAFSLTLLRDGKLVTVDGLKATLKVGEGHRGLGVSLFNDEKSTVVAGVVKGSAAEAAGLKPGDALVSVAGQPVRNWFDVRRQINRAAAASSARPLVVGLTYARPNVEHPQTADLKLDAEQVANVQDIRYTNLLTLNEFTIKRQTRQPLVAAGWGITETRDFILQFYLTLRRMIDGSVSPSNMMGPLGIFSAGTRFAYKGNDWLLWFLCMISANLAVVNFLPIPVVDGGQFVFLVLEKIKGKPLSPKAMAIAQYVGLAFLAAVVLFVTYNDYLRHFG